MKKLFIPIALMALCLTACDKEEKEAESTLNYSMTEVNLKYEFSQDYRDLYDIFVEGKDFEGKNIDMTIGTKGQQVFSTKATKGETTIRVYSVPKEDAPKIESRDYTLKKMFNGSIGSVSKEGKGYTSYQTIDFAGGTSTTVFDGDSIIAHPEIIKRKSFDKTLRLSLAVEKDVVVVEANVVE